MPRDILSEYGEDTNKPQASRAKSGGVKEAQPLRYSPPQGPTDQNQKGPGLHGEVRPKGTQHGG